MCVACDFVEIQLAIAICVSCVEYSPGIGRFAIGEAMLEETSYLIDIKMPVMVQVCPSETETFLCRGWVSTTAGDCSN